MCVLCGDQGCTFKNVRVHASVVPGFRTRLWRCRSCSGVFPLEEPASKLHVDMRRGGQAHAGTDCALHLQIAVVSRTLVTLQIVFV